MVILSGLLLNHSSYILQGKVRWSGGGVRILGVVMGECGGCGVVEEVCGVVEVWWGSVVRCGERVVEVWWESGKVWWQSGFGEARVWLCVV